ncbi:MAG: hypothetical protein UR78_C0017G0010 [Candidatus Moranbacteria bacterium GW2011_GWF2_35_39]|nr:MAG: hypothetical protein UR78_C0017G0010 [Candidatus Moranbacteria bacterium GW2011_GWF2_35_39]
MNHNKEEIVDNSKKEQFAEVIDNPPRMDLSEALLRANLKKGGADRFAEILTIKK